MKEKILIILSSVDPLIKKELFYVVGGASLGFLSGKLVEIIVIKTFGKKLKDISEPEEPNLPKTKFRRFLLRGRGGDIFTVGTILNLIRTGNDIFTFVGMIGGFGYFLKSVDNVQLVDIIKGTTIEKARQLALPSTALIEMADTLKDASCTLTFNMLVRILLDRGIPYDKKEEEIHRFFSKIDFKKVKNKVILIFCIINLLIMLYTTGNMAGYLLLMAKLRELFRTGKLSKVIYYAILRALRKEKIPVGFEIDEVLRSQ